MKKIIPLVLFSSVLFAYGDSWTQKAAFGGGFRLYSVGFSIGSKGYMGTGFYPGFKNDFWEYNPATNVWTQKADCGTARRDAAAGFSIGSKGYIGTGYDSSSFRNDFLEYDTAANTWTPKTSFGGTARYFSVSFSIGSKGYIGTGYDNSIGVTKDFWEYDQSLDTWAQKADFGGTAREEAVGFSISNKGYIGTGVDNSGMRNDFWEYDTASNSWSQRTDFGGIPRRNAAGFSINGKGYIGTGGYNTPFGGVYNKDFWEFDPLANTWTKKADFAGGSGRLFLTAFSVNGKGYMGTGIDSVNYRMDVWEYTPDSIATAINDFPSSGFQFQVWPNPAHDLLRLTPGPSPRERGAGATIEIYNVLGEKVSSSYCELRTANSEIIDVSGLSEGLYFIVAVPIESGGRERAVRKFVKE